MPNDDHFALVIGIDAYECFSGLEGAVNDAKNFIAWLADPRGGDVPAENVRSLFTDGTTQDPRFDVVLDEVARFVGEYEEANGARIGTRLYIYLAGHGINVGDLGDCGLVVTNASLVMNDRNLPGKLLARKLMSAGAFDEVVLLMDCCREVIAKNPSGQLPVLNRLQTVPASGTVVEGLATKWNRFSREKTLPDLGGNGSSVQGIFTHAVLDGLRRAVDENGNVTAEQLRGYVREYADRLGAADQTAEILADPRDIVICTPTDPTTTVYVTTNPPGTGFDVRDGSLNVMSNLTRAPGDAGFVSVPLEPGTYTFCTPAGRSFDEYDARVTRKVMGREDEVVLE